MFLFRQLPDSLSPLRCRAQEFIQPPTDQFSSLCKEILVTTDFQEFQCRGNALCRERTCTSIFDQFGFPVLRPCCPERHKHRLEKRTALVSSLQLIRLDFQQTALSDISVTT
ncbi:MAG: hypothetical protein ACK6D4_09525 [Planctomyces sp.]